MPGTLGSRGGSKLEHKEMVNEIDEIVQAELQYARSCHEKWTSSHHGYAIILEELEELQAEIKQFGLALNCLWNKVKENDIEGQEQTIQYLQEDITKVIKEAIQVAAMCQRYQEDILSK
jgi:hypothetical protein